MSDTIDIYQNFFSATSRLWHDGLSLENLGESGELINTPLQYDSWVNLFMVIFFTLSVVMIIKARGYLSYKFHNLTRRPLLNSTILFEASKKASYLTYFIYQGIFVASLLCYAYVIEAGALPLASDNVRYLALGLFALAFLGYLAIRKCAIVITHATFFDRQQRNMSKMERHFFLALESATLLPAAIAYMYLGCSAEKSILIALLMIIISKTLSLYKQYLIFFSKNSRFLRFFLYLCTLEAIPVAILIGILGFITHTLSTNF